MKLSSRDSPSPSSMPTWTLQVDYICKALLSSNSAKLTFLYSWKKFLSLVGVEVIEKKKKLTNGITKAEPGTPGTPATPQTAAISDDLAGKSFITTKELDSLADEEIVSLLASFSSKCSCMRLPQERESHQTGHSRRSSVSFVKQRAARHQTH